jgi:hypothetical protein
MDIERVERMLARTPAPEPVPAMAAAAAHRAVFGEPDAVVTRSTRQWRWPASWRIASAAAAFGAAVAVAIVLAVGGRGGFSTQNSIALSGPHGATAEVDFGHISNGVRPMLVHIKGLHPAGTGRYYQMWFRTGGEKVSAVTFDTAAGGTATFRAVIPAGMHWHNCWVTLETASGHGTRVLYT